MSDARRRTITFVVTEQCNLRCGYCYMVGKNNDSRMHFLTAKKTIDYALRHLVDQPEVVWEFIGGEPLLEVELIERVVDYAYLRMFELNHPWFMTSMFSMTTNGVLYHDPRFQALLDRYPGRIDVTITVDGLPEAHDAARRTSRGDGSHARVLENVKLWLQRSPRATTKVTIVPATLPYLAKSVAYLLDLGIKAVHANCVFEDVWQGDGLPRLFEDQLDLLAEMLRARGRGAEACSLFGPHIGKHAIDDRNWCGAGTYMLAVDSRALFYPCVRFMQFALNKKRPWVIGNVSDGIQEITLRPFEDLTKTNQSPPQCLECEVDGGCAWCSGFNYDDGALNKRTTYLCEMHKARVRANRRFLESLTTGGSS